MQRSCACASNSREPAPLDDLGPHPGTSSGGVPPSWLLPTTTLKDPGPGTPLYDMLGRLGGRGAFSHQWHGRTCCRCCPSARSSGSLICLRHCASSWRRVSSTSVATRSFLYFSCSRITLAIVPRFVSRYKHCLWYLDFHTTFRAVVPT